MDKIGKNLFEAVEPIPSNVEPVNIKDNWVKINGEFINIKTNKKLKRIFNANGKWYVEWEE